MASGRDDVLSLDDSDESFSGFSSVSSNDAPKMKTKSKKKQISNKPGPGKKTKSSKVNTSKKVKESSGLDISKLSTEDVEKLRGLLGFSLPREETFEEEEYEAVPLGERPPLRIEFDNDEYNANAVNSLTSQDMSNALFEGDEDENWELPRLKAPEKGKPVAQSLAKLINVSCTLPCDIDPLVKEHCIPENCDKAGPPRVNQEIWKILDKRAQSQDRALADVQALLAASMTPIIKLADLLKSQISGNSEAKKLISDTITLLGQSQYNLSLRRRYALRPSLKKKYHSLCNVSMPITNQLFGDEISKDIKVCDSQQSIGKESFGYRPQMFRGRGRFQRRPYSSYGQRFQPYSNRGQARFQSPGRAGYYAPRKAPTATVTAPNGKD